MNFYEGVNMLFSIPGCFTAGGAVLSSVTKTQINDYDIYPKHQEGLNNALAYFFEDEGGFVVNYTSKAITIKTNDVDVKTNLRDVYQIILTDFYPTAESIFNHFDFTVCMGAVDGDTKELITHKDFWPDIASKTLNFNEKTLFPLNSILRVSKYLTKGYFISKPQMIKMAATVCNKGFPKTWEDLEGEIGGTYGKLFSLDEDIKKLECNFDNVIKVIDSINIDSLSYQDQADYYANFKYDCWYYLLDKAKKTKYFTKPLEGSWNIKDVTEVIVEEDGNYFYLKVPFIPSHWIKMNEDEIVNIKHKVFEKNIISLPIKKSEYYTQHEKRTIKSGDIVENLHFKVMLEPYSSINPHEILLSTSVKDIVEFGNGYLSANRWEVM